jgi:hypothetical protein
MTEPPRPSGGPLTQGLVRAMQTKQHPPSTPLGAQGRFGWQSGDLASIMNVSPRTARRWRQQNRVPLHRQADWQRAVRDETARRQREQIEARGLRNMQVTGEYRVSRSRYRSRAGAPVRIGPGRDRISGATMRDVFTALDEGRADDAERVLNDALGDAYGAPGLRVESVDSLSYTVR